MDMPYIAFLDMVGTRAFASIGKEEYTAAIKDFHDVLRDVGGQIDNSCIYGYSDNAYIEVKELSDMMSLLQMLRKNLILRHRFFTAAVDYGSLNAKNVAAGTAKGSLMIFTSPATIDLYLMQCKFTGIGFFLSRRVVDDLVRCKMTKFCCPSVFLHSQEEDPTQTYLPVMDIAYAGVNKSTLASLFSEYITTSVMSKRAGRYYVTPIVSMIKCIDYAKLKKELEGFVKLITFQNVPESFRHEGCESKYAKLFVYALIENILTAQINDKEMSKRDCKQILEYCDIPEGELIGDLSCIPVEVISNFNKRRFMTIVYGYK